MRRCFALLYTRVSFLYPSLSLSLLFFSFPAARLTDRRCECPECLGEREVGVRAVSVRDTLISRFIHRNMETRFGPLAREKLALWPAFIRIFLEEGFLEIVGTTGKNIALPFSL